MAFGAIKGEESSTITFKARTITHNQNSTTMHQEIVSVGGVGSSLAIAAVLDAAPASTDWGLVTRQFGYSTIVTVAAMPAGSTTVSVAALPANSSQVAVTSMPAGSTTVTVSFAAGYVSTSALAVGSSGVAVRLASEVATGFDHGSNRDIDTTAEQINSASVIAQFGVLVKADVANTGTLFIGNSDVTAGTTDATDGFPLTAGESLLVKVSNVNVIYAISSTTNQIVYWMTV